MFGRFGLGGARGLSGAGPAGPQPIASSDFAAGTYSIGGVAKAVGDLWYQHGSWFAFDPATHIIPGEGFGLNASGTTTQFGPGATAELLAALGLTDGFSMVVDMKAVGVNMELITEITTLPGFSPESLIRTWVDRTEVLNLPGADSYTAHGSGEHTFAYTLAANGATHLSLNGGAVASTAAGAVTMAGLNNLFLKARNYGGGPTTALIRRMTFYNPLAAGDLPAMSA